MNKTELVAAMAKETAFRAISGTGCTIVYTIMPLQLPPLHRTSPISPKILPADSL